MFGIDIIDAGFATALVLALIGGLISFVSPCVLPIVPPYLAYMGGISMSDMREQRANRAVVGAAFLFVLGLSTVFIILGYTFSVLGQFVAQYQHLLNWFAGGILIVFGLHFLHVLTLPFLHREARFDVGDRGGSAFGAYLLGLAFAFGWSPCLGPVLSAILAMAAEEGQGARGAILLGTYAAGLGVPFILAAVFINRAMGVMARLKRHMRLIEALMGALLLVIGVLLISGRFSVMAFWLLDRFPALAYVG